MILWHSSTISGRFLSSGRTATLYGARSGWSASDDPLLAADLLLAVGVDEERERRPVAAGRRLDDPRDEVLLGRRVEVLEVLAGRLGLVPTGRSRPGCGSPRAPSSRTGSGTRRRSPSSRSGPARRAGARGSAAATGSRRSARTRRAGAAATPRRRAAASSGRTKYCISICSNSRIRKTKLPGLISLRNALPIWAIPNGSFLRDGSLDVLEVDVDALRGLGPQVDDRRLLLDRAHVRLEHQVELARRRQRAAVDRAACRPRRSTIPGSSRSVGQVLRARAARRAGSAGGRSRTRPADR